MNQFQRYGIYLLSRSFQALAHRKNNYQPSLFPALFLLGVLLYGPSVPAGAQTKEVTLFGRITMQKHLSP